MTPIDSFVELETIIEGEQYPIEGSNTTGLKDFVENHLANTFRMNIGQGAELTKQYYLQVGSVIEIQPTEWAKKFTAKQGLGMGHYYGKPFVVKDVSVEYLTQNLRRGLPDPLVIIRVKLVPQ